MNPIFETLFDACRLEEKREEEELQQREEETERASSEKEPLASYLWDVEWAWEETPGETERVRRNSRDCVLHDS